MNNVTVKISPPTGTPLLDFLEKNATSLPSQNLQETDWESIDPKMLPVALIESPTGKFGYVLYNKEEMMKYSRNHNSGDLKKHYYMMMIDKLWEVTNLFNVRYLIEADRVHSKSKDKVKIAQIRKELLEMVVTHLNRSMDLDDIARHFNVGKQTVAFYAKKLREAGASIPEGRKGVDYGMFVRNLAKTRPELVSKDIVHKIAAPIDVHVKRKPGRPPKKH